MNISATYDTGRKSMFRRWLISDPDLRRLSSLEAGKNLLGKRSLSNQNFRSVTLVGPGTIGTPTLEPGIRIKGNLRPHGA